MKYLEGKKQEEEQLYQEFHGKKTVEGFRLYRCEQRGKKGRRYYSWKAYRSRNGEEENVYIGQDPREAPDKIRAYLEKLAKKSDE